MEEEIDLRPYILALFQRWRLIILITAVTVVAVVLITLARSQPYTASADVLILPIRSQLAFDPRFVTGDTTQSISESAWQKALTELASSTVLDERVRDNPPPELAGQDFQTGELANRIQVRTDGNLLRLTASGEDATTAKALVDAWAHNYVRLVNDIYSQDSTLVQDVEQQLSEAQQRYDSAQEELATFVGTGQLVQVEQRLGVVEGILKGSSAAQQMLYSQYLTRTQELDLILRDAQTLREEVAASPTEDLSSSLAALALRARVAGNVQLPVDLRFDDPGAFAQGGGATVTDLDTLITTLQQRRITLLELSQQLAQSIITGEGESTGLPADLSNQYEQELALLKQQYERQTAQQKFLEQQRDLALESLGILQRKLDEQRIAQGTSQAEVQLVGVVIDPVKSMTSRLVVNGGIALLVGLFMGIIAVLGLEIIRPRLANSQPQPAGERTADQPAAS